MEEEEQMKLYGRLVPTDADPLIEGDPYNARKCIKCGAAHYSFYHGACRCSHETVSFYDDYATGRRIWCADCEMDLDFDETELNAKYKIVKRE